MDSRANRKRAQECKKTTNETHTCSFVRGRPKERVLSEGAIVEDSNKENMKYNNQNIIYVDT